jgi:hypothetical protein
MRRFSLALAAGLMLAGAAVQAEEAPPPVHNCFSITDWNGWRASTTDKDVLYIKVRLHDVYKVTLTDAEPFLNAPDVHLVSKTWGPDTVCNPHDLDLKLADWHGVATPLIVKDLRKLTPDEIAALPPRDKP